MKAAILGLCLLSTIVTGANAVTFMDSTTDDTTLDLTVVWDATFPGMNGLVADIFTPPWWFYQVLENDATAVIVSSGGFDSTILFGASRRFADASILSSVNVGYGLTVDAVPGNDYAARFLATAPSLPDGGGTLAYLACSCGMLFAGRVWAARSTVPKSEPV